VINNKHRWLYPNSLLINQSPEDERYATETFSHRSKITTEVHQFEKDLLKLSEREMQCLHLSSNGNTAKETAIELGLTHRTVEHYLNNCKVKLNCDFKRELVMKYREVMCL